MSPDRDSSAWTAAIVGFKTPACPVVPMQIPTLDDLDGQIALVTGGNRGMGAVTAAALVASGATAYVGVRDPAPYHPPKGHIPIALDVTNDDSVRAALATIRSDKGRLDILVNNAGIAPGVEYHVGSEPMEEFDDVIATNVRGPFLVTQAAVPLLLETDAPRVVNMSSGMGSLTDGVGAVAPAYSMSKTALNALTVHLDEAFSGQGLLANSVCPGWVRTDMGGPSASRSPEEGAATPIWLAHFAPGAPGGRFWRDKEIIDW